MTQLTWGVVGKRFYEVGVDRGVLFVGNKNGVVWNGLVSVSENPIGGEATPYYIDGVKYLNQASLEEFEATIEAYTYPSEFEECDGSSSMGNGLSATQQMRTPFGLSYRTQVGNEVDGLSHGYKLHIIYNALASPSQRSHATLSSAIDPFNFSWKLTTSPALISDHRFASHFVADSRTTPSSVMSTIENILYGTDGVASRLPTAQELVYIFQVYNTSSFDAGVVPESYYATFDGDVLNTIQTSSIDGGGP